MEERPTVLRAGEPAPMANFKDHPFQGPAHPLSPPSHNLVSLKSLEPCFPLTVTPSHDKAHPHDRCHLPIRSTFVVHVRDAARAAVPPHMPTHADTCPHATSTCSSPTPGPISSHITHPHAPCRLTVPCSRRSAQHGANLTRRRLARNGLCQKDSTDLQISYV